MDKMNKMKKVKTRNVKGPEPVILSPLQVTLEEAKGDTTKLIKKFSKKVRRAEVLKPYFNKLMYFTPKSDLKRQKRRKAVWEEKKRREKEEIL